MDNARAVVLVGGGGFIGRALAGALVAQDTPTIALVRRDAVLPAPVIVRRAGDLDAASDWPALLADARAVVHLAGRAHAPMSGDAEAWIARETALAEALARAAAARGVERFVLVSSIKVNGDATGATPFRPGDAPAPGDAYGRAKLRSEQAVQRVAEAAGMPLVILRPPLVYGPGVRANFLALLRLVDRGLPLPLASVDNRRSLVFLDTLVDLLVIALSHAAAPGRLLLVRDDRDVSTPALIALIARQLSRRPHLFPCPPALLRALARLAGRGESAARLLDSLSVDDSETRSALGWRPKITLAEGIAATCRWYRAPR